MPQIQIDTKARFIIKGAEAALWLKAQGIATPGRANQWLASNNLLVLRLGQSEFLVEGEQHDAMLLQLSQAEKPSACYEVSNAYTSFSLGGKHVQQLLASICRLDLALELREKNLVMTQVAGISAILIDASTADVSSYRMWCDISYEVYMQHTLNTVLAQLSNNSTN